MSWNWVGHQVRGWMGRGTGDGHLLSPAQIKEAAVAMRQLPDRRLAAQIVELRQRTASVERTFLAFAATYEAARRVLSVELYDVQLEAGLALSRGEIAQMQTGEGKTFTALAPAVTLALCGRGVHVMTVNPYLAKRDFQLLQPVYQFLGLDAALLTRELSPEQKQLAYRADVTFGDGCEFGFDFLRDQSAKSASRQRPLGDNFRRQLQGVHDYHLRLQRGHAGQFAGHRQ